MTRRRYLKAALVTLLVGFCALESLAWARLGLADAVRGSSPTPAVFRDGTAGFYSLRYDDARRPRYVGVRVWAADGSFLGEDDANHPTGVAGLRFRDQLPMPGTQRGRRFGVDRDFDTARFLRSDDYDAWGRGDVPAQSLNSFGGFFVPLRPGEWGGTDPMIVPGRRDGFSLWSFEDGRFVLRRVRERTVLVVAGPGGVSDTLDAPTIGRFGPLWSLGSVRLASGSQGRFVSRFLEPDAARLVEVEVGRVEQSPAVEARVRTIPLTPAPAGGRPDPSRLWYAHSPKRALAVDAEGRVWSDVRAREDEWIAWANEISDLPPGSKAVRRFVTTSRVDAGDPLVAAVRFRVQMYGEDVQTWDLVWRRQGAAEEALAALACVPAVLGPSALAVTSFASALPTDGDGGSSWWWRDPVLAGQRRPLVLAANVLLAALCAFLAWRVARVHCATSRAAKAWTLVGLLLGPLGLLLLRLLAVRAPAEQIGAGRRSLALETCPATDTPWPLPARTGREIFVES